MERSYEYVGPGDLLRLVRPEAVGEVVESIADFTAWVARTPSVELDEPFTYVVDLSGYIRLAARRSEHVACAAGQRVMAAGEIAFDKRSSEGWTVSRVSNQSTGYCPDLSSWDAVASALDRIGLSHPPAFTEQVVFRRCPACAELNVVKDGFFACAFCDSDLPPSWNVATIAPQT
ncbi:hypothetical protein [Actinospica acidithermotolerans]|uniref:hypothetical protein n=1 Tax=Actinospica acidithermotolerans TaxID=2828514 RepID=UPI0027DCFA9B|nr:hypothetical protein [Actinospica acidithermotolerans]